LAEKSGLSSLAFAAAVDEPDDEERDEAGEEGGAEDEGD
jgi:hypothetical protein